MSSQVQGFPCLNTIASLIDIIFLQHRGTINSNMYLILEAKGKGKTHEAVDYVAVSLGELFAGAG